MNDNEIRNKISSLNNEYISLTNKIYNLNKELQSIQETKLSKLIGNCYKDSDSVFMVTGVPRYTVLVNGETHFNPYQIPVLRCFISESDIFTKGELSVISDLVYSKAVDSDDVETAISEEYEQITYDEFCSCIHTTINKFLANFN